MKKCKPPNRSILSGVDWAIASIDNEEVFEAKIVYYRAHNMFSRIFRIRIYEIFTNFSLIGQKMQFWALEKIKTDTYLLNLFMTSKKRNQEFTNLKCCKKIREPFKTLINGALFLIYHFEKHKVLQHFNSWTGWNITKYLVEKNRRFVFKKFAKTCRDLDLCRCDFVISGKQFLFQIQTLRNSLYN